MITFGQITAAVRGLQALENFIEGKMAAVMTAVAENELQAATQALEDVPDAQDKKIPVNQALVHLQSAHNAYKKMYAERRAIMDHVRMATQMAAIQKDVFTLCLMAICYKYLREPILMEKILDEALAAIKPWTRVTRSYTIGDLIDPRKLKDYISDTFWAMKSWANPTATFRVSLEVARGKFPEISEEELRQFCSVLRSGSTRESADPPKKQRRGN